MVSRPLSDTHTELAAAADNDVTLARSNNWPERSMRRDIGDSGTRTTESAPFSDDDEHAVNKST